MRFGPWPAEAPEGVRAPPVPLAYVESLEHRVRQLERRNETLKRLAEAAAHELIEPLVMTETCAALLSDRLDPVEQADSRRDLDVLSRGALRVRLVAESLLQDARCAGRDIHLERVDVGELVHDCLALLKPDICSRCARVEVRELPDVEADEALLSCAFSNLLVNALKYSPRERSRIEVSGRREPGFCRYFVNSEGPPIAAEDRDRIFEVYQRGSSERRVAGVGLGLAICRRIVRRHGGEIGVEPAPGRGNRFHFTIPD